MSALSQPVRTAIVGLGWWGRKMTDLVAAGGAGLRFVLAVEPDPSGAEFAGARGIPVAASLDEALAEAEVEAVVLATPHALHEAQIAAAVKAGKHVFCEKPLALTKAGAETAVRLCRDAGVVLGMGHERRFEPPIAAILADAAAGRLGRLLQIEANFSHDKFLTLDAANWRLQANQAPAGGMTATGIHLTDLAVKLMGPARDVRVSCEQLASAFPQGDTMSAHIRFTGGGTAYVSATLATPFISRFAVFGTKGWVEVRDKAHVEAPDGWVVTRGDAGAPIGVAETGKAEPVRDNLAAFSRAVRGEAPYPITGDEMIANIALLEAIVRSAATGAVEAVA
ncbi:putative dehydrogenase [Inquilinus ginsengisoli]|uniref:Dehydrogenase n=1 Tax=Inquilinus ginsengisoli TaxID=363840 RepID=A0ABU1JQC8_9PROT|nr:Gfo/Idh/MocA family oxidoreductase [Inquilinus ginsengisoli]MDR6290829.1 putative dehydrogenase [Inquilinus ginsengisoli]